MPIVQKQSKEIDYMYMELEQIIYSPSDLTLFMDSPFASWMEHLAITHPIQLPVPDEPDELMTVLQHKGLHHEIDLLNHFIQKDLVVTQVTNGADAFQETLSAMQSGADVIYQAALSLFVSVRPTTVYSSPTKSLN